MRNKLPVILSVVMIVLLSCSSLMDGPTTPPASTNTTPMATSTATATPIPPAHDFLDGSYETPTRDDGSDIAPEIPGTLGVLNVTEISRTVEAGEYDELGPYLLISKGASGFQFFGSCSRAGIRLTVGSGGMKEGDMVQFGLDARYARPGSTCAGTIALVLWNGSFHAATQWEVHLIKVQITVE